MIGTPDAEYTVITWLSDFLTDRGFTGVDVDTRYEGAVPAVVVERIGGIADYLGVVDHPRLDITTWHSTKAAAHDLAAATREGVHRINGQVVGSAVCGSVTEVLGLNYIPDDTSEGLPRYLFTVEITMRALVA